MNTNTYSYVEFAKTAPTIAATPTTAPAAPVVRQPKYHGLRRFGGVHHLPIGMVDLTTGKNAMFGTIWNCWKQDEKDSNILVREGDKFKAIHTCGSADNYKAGDTMCLRHDQTGARIGGIWTIVGIAQHTPEGMLKLKELSGKTSVAFSTFK
jgi:hypothetical protein